MKTSTLRKGSKYHGYTIISRMDSKKKSYRQVYRCVVNNKEGVLVRFILNDMPGVLTCPIDGTCKPIEYVFCDYCQKLNPFDVLPNIWSCGADTKEAWYVRDYVEGRTLREEIEYDHEISKDDDMELILSVSSWIAINGHMLFRFLPTFMKYNLSPDNLFVTSDIDGMPKLIMWDLESVLSVESGIYATDWVKVDARFLPPEILCDKFDEKSYVYVFAMLMVFCLRGSMPDDDIFKGDRYEDLIHLTWFKDSLLDDVNLDEDRKELLLDALSSNPDERPSFKEFTKKWSEGGRLREDTEVTSGAKCNQHNENKRETTDLGQPNQFDGMFCKGNGNGLSDVVGMEDLKTTLIQNIIYPAKYPELAETYGIERPNGMLLYGPPGCGKSYVAVKICEETGCYYIKIKSSDLGGQWYREGVSNIGSLFRAAERQSRLHGNQPVFIIIDEADGVLGTRRPELSTGQAQETNQFLTELETCGKRGVFVIATSNDPREIDPAALRTGRLGDLVVYVPLPDEMTKNAILKMGLSKLPCDNNIDTNDIIKLTANFSSSDVSEIARKSGVYAMSIMISNLENKGVNDIVPITDEIVRKCTAEITPSLSRDEILRHSQIHESFSHRNTDKRPKIGFR